MEATDYLLELWQKDRHSKKEIGIRFSKRHLYFGGCGSILSLHSRNTEQLLSDGASEMKGCFTCKGVNGIRSCLSFSEFL
ncbi:hypothetical protein MKX03_015576 [Papaver bracteatum]|nr:hypothetical protein MKX03_015576 [Papaver bracteatum]